jgi:hypothetical protein
VTALRTASIKDFLILIMVPRPPFVRANGKGHITMVTAGDRTFHKKWNFSAACKAQIFDGLNGPT